MNIKKLSDMTIKDSFIFYALMNDEELCRELLTLILEVEIDEVSVHREESLFYNPQYHGVRLNVIAVEKGSKRKFNVEMQTRKKDNLAKRSRYYHSHMDMDLLHRGYFYDELPDTYVIFLCDFDPFGDQLYCYRYQMHCSENGRFLMDGTHTVFLNTHGQQKEGLSKELIAFLDYCAKPDTVELIEDNFVQRIDQKISSIKADRVWEEYYMLLEEMLREERTEGREEGLAEGRAEGHAEGREEGEQMIISAFLEKGYTPELIAEVLGKKVEDIRALVKTS